MTFEEFISLNGASVSTDNFCMMERGISYPEGEFTAEFTIIMYVSAGKASISVDGVPFSINGRSIAVVHPGQRLHVHEIAPDFHCKLLAMGGEIGMELSISDVFLTMFIFDETPVLKITSSFADAATLFFEAFERVNRFEDNPYKKDCLVNLLRSFFYSAGYFLMRSLKFRESSKLYSISSRFSAHAESNIKEFISLVEKHSQTERRLAFYADSMGYHPKYLSSMIKKETGYTAQELIDKYAILKAMSKLAYGTKSIKEIATEMDFPSQSDFGKYFKRNTGKSPLEYRKIRERLASRRK